MKRIRDALRQEGVVRRFGRDRSGAAALMFGMTAVPLILAAGVAVDYGNHIRVLSELQTATDAAALAAGRKAGSNQDELLTIAKTYFNANYTPVGGHTPTVSLTSDVSTVEVTATVAVDNYLMRLVTSDTSTLTARSEVTKEANGLEVALVFDNTGSMLDFSRLVTLKSAAGDFVDILFGDRTTAEKLKMAIVPFAATVNIGTDNVNSGWLDKTGASTASHYNFNNATWHNWSAWQTLNNRDWDGCVEARTGSYAFDDTPPGSGQTLFPAYFAPDEPGSNTSTSTVSGNTYYNSYLSDSSTTSLDTRQRHPNKYTNANVSVTSRGPDWGCGVTPITPLTNVKATVVNAIDAMVASGATVIPEGVMWGLRVLSPEQPYNQGVAFDNPEKIKKVMILLTDGENDVGSGGSQLNNHNKTWYNAFGYAAQNRLGTTSFSTFHNVLDQKTRDACDLVKSKGVIIYSFAYYAPTKGEQLMLYCASDPEKYFDPPTNAVMVQYFQQVADELRNLYLSK